MPSADIAVGLTQAELQLNQQQLEQALATLRHLQQLAPQHKKVLQALSALYCKLNDWQHLADMMPDLRKKQVYPAERLDQMDRMAHIELLGQAGGADHQALQAVWYRVPRSVQENEEVLINYLRQLQRQGKTDIAEPLIRNALKRSWSEPLIHFYGIIDAPDVNSQLAFAESLLKTRENNAMLLLTLGRLYLKAALWGKARACLEASINVAGHPEAYNELGHLLEKTGEKDKAIDCYRKGLANTPGCEKTISIPTAHASIENKPTATALISDTPIVAG
jgi:HemY protein